MSERLAPSREESVTIRLRTGRDFSLYNPRIEVGKSYSVPAGVYVDGYDIIDEVGRGGMGIVFKARCARLNRHVALKMVLTGEFTSHKEAERFRAEADAVAQLQHPNIVQVYEVGESSGRPYMAMEFVDGGTLAKRANDEPQPVEATAEMVELLARALHAAHQRGVLHRDLKPSNVLLTPITPGQELRSAPHALAHFGSPKITDFGLSKRLDNDQAFQSQTLMGTPSYMAPEQTEASQESGARLGPATDVYGLGAVLYELLTGRPPFEGADPMDTVVQVRTLDPISPTYWSPRLPKDIETICLKCLEKDPGRRYQTAEALADDLRRFLDGQPIHARPTSTTEKAIKWAKRRPAVAGLLAACFVLAIAGFSGILMQWQEAESERVKAEELAQKESDARQTADRRRIDAEESRERATKAEEWARAELKRSARSLYVSRINNSRLHWQGNNVRGAILELMACEPQYRGIEWQLLHRRYNSELWSMKFEQCAQRIVPTNDGKRVYIATGDPAGFSWASELKRPGELIYWDLTTERPIWTSTGLSASLRQLALSADERWLAVVGANEAMNLLDAKTGAILKTFNHVTGEPAFHPNEPILVIPGRDSITILNTETLETTAEWKTNKTDLIARVCYSPNSEVVLVRLLHPSRMEVRNARTGEIVRTGPVPHGATISPDGRWVAGVRDLNMIELWDFGTDWLKPERNSDQGELKGRLAYRVPGHDGPIQALAFSPDNRLLATGGNDTTVRLCNLVTGQQTMVFRGQETGISDVRFSSCGQYLLSAAQYGRRVKIWDLSRDPATSNVANSPVVNIEAIAITPDGKELLSIGLHGNLTCWNLNNGLEICRHHLGTFANWQSPVRRAVFDPEVKRVAAASSDGRNVCFFDVRTGKPLMTLEGHTVPVGCMAISPDNKWLATAAFVNKRDAAFKPTEMILWDLSAGKIHRRWNDVQHRIYSFKFSSDGRELIAGGGFPTQGDHGVLQSLQVPDGEWQELARTTDPVLDESASDNQPEPLPKSIAPSEFINAVAIHPQGKMIATAQYRGTIVGVWDVEQGADGRRTARFRQSIVTPARIYELQYTPDGQRLIGSGRDGVRIWDPANGQELLHLRGAPTPGGDPGINPQLALAPDGKGIAANNWNATISFWSAEQLTEKSRPCERRYAAERTVDFRLNTAELAIRDEQYESADHHLAAAHAEQRSPTQIHHGFRLNGSIQSWQRAWDLVQRYHGEGPQAVWVSEVGTPVALKAGGPEGYQAHCRKFCNSLPSDVDPWSAGRFIMACYLSDQPAGLPDVMLRWKEIVGREPRAQNFMSVIECAERLQKQQWKEAIEAGSQAAQAGKEDPLVQQFRGRLFCMIAIAHAHLNRNEEARQWAEKADQWRQTEFHGRRVAGWWEQLAVELLKEEFERVIQQNK